LRTARPIGSLVFARPHSGRFQISNAALEMMHEFVQDEPHKPEAGGVLLGRHILDTRDIVVDRVSAPMPGDQQSRFRFYRAHRRHQRVIDDAWRTSGGTCTYLGEWHTHPEQCPTPSPVDEGDWRRKLATDQFSGCLFFAVVGTGATRVWEGAWHDSNLLQLALVP